MSSDATPHSPTVRNCLSLTGVIATSAEGPRVEETVADALAKELCLSAKTKQEEGASVESGVLRIALADDTTAVDLSSLSDGSEWMYF